jgi:hypothetical protein
MEEYFKASLNKKVMEPILINKPGMVWFACDPNKAKGHRWEDHNLLWANM